PVYEKLGTFYLGRVVDNNGKDTSEPVMYDARDLTTHAVCVGMTGSGKTGLCLSLLEEAAIDGIPVLAIDPKGDIANLALQFPQLRGADFLPWVDAGEARRKGQSIEEFANTTAANWKKGLADWDQDGERIQRLCDAAEVAIYTPGNNAGRGLSVLRSFAAPDAALRNDSSSLQERIAGAAAGLLALLSIDADPLKSREYILLSNLLSAAWSEGQDLDLAALIQQIQKPPFDKVGVFDLETFFPAKERLGLAMAINNLLAAPSFAAWMQGEALDIQSLLFTASGKPRIAIISIAHLNDAERMFIVTLLLNEVVAWMRRQSGTSALRALVYMDEIFGYFPPTAMPPSKLPLLTLMKQARAFGVGVVLATQNPVDLDYKGLSNAGTWFIGRLQTERDKARVVEGLLSGAGDGLDKAEIEALIANLSQRVFLMRNVHEAAPVLLRTRWAMSYLRGPITLQEIQQLKQANPLPVAADTANKPVVNKIASKPVLPAGVNEYYLNAGAANTYVPRLLGLAKIHFVDSKTGVDEWQTRALLAPITDDGSGPDWSAATELSGGKAALTTQVMKEASYADLPAALLGAKNYAGWSKELSGEIYRGITHAVYSCDALKVSSKPSESEGEFRARISLQLREQRDAEVDRLRKKYASRLQTLENQQQRAEQKIEKEKSQLSQQKLNTALSVGASILGAFFGRKVASSANVTRAASAARSATRISRESQDVDQAADSLEAIQQRFADLQAELETEITKVQDELDPAAVALSSVEVKARKTDTVVSEVALVWQAV
ncbi:MAG: ATP-binding protein, partial [Steroidobacteraceae bacterium]